jgi:hypothetical protein
VKTKVIPVIIGKTETTSKKVIPVIIGKTETTSKSIRKFLSNVPGKARYKKTKKNSHFGNNTRTSEGTDVKVQNICRGK